MELAMGAADLVMSMRSGTDDGSQIKELVGGNATEQAARDVSEEEHARGDDAL